MQAICVDLGIAGRFRLGLRGLPFGPLHLSLSHLLISVSELTTFTILIIITVIIMPRLTQFETCVDICRTLLKSKPGDTATQLLLEKALHTNGKPEHTVMHEK